MATKKPKKLNYQKVRGELELLAGGANGGGVSVNDDFPHLPAAMNCNTFAQFASAVRDRFFDGYRSTDALIFSMVSMPDWEDFDTLTAAIIKDRFRMDSNAAQNQGGA